MKSATPGGGLRGPALRGIGAEAQLAPAMPAFFRVGIRAGEPLIMPTLPAAKSFHRSVRFFVAGSASVRPGLTRLSVSHWNVSMFACWLIAHLPEASL